uniref:Uncharacterized protein n=1 Tax=Ascaris lumbricoides TaxID=6252 RepID=A0A9J2PGM1_ASCLU
MSMLDCALVSGTAQRGADPHPITSSHRLSSFMINRINSKVASHSYKGTFRCHEHNSLSSYFTDSIDETIERITQLFIDGTDQHNALLQRKFAA